MTRERTESDEHEGSSETEQEAAAAHASGLDAGQAAREEQAARLDRLAREGGRSAPPFFGTERSTHEEDAARRLAGRSCYGARSRVLGSAGGDARRLSYRSQGRTAMKSESRSPSSAPARRSCPRMSSARSIGSAGL